MTIFTITFNRAPAATESKLPEAHQRFMAKLRAWDRPRWPVQETRTIQVSRACLKYLLDDPEADVFLITVALADLYELRIVDRKIPDVDLFQNSVKDVSVELTLEREAAREGLDPVELRRVYEARKAARAEAV